ncbi:hypothetical protein IT575_00090 [bacterium]|nr:hypothetical protein [bacterium]
MSFFHAIVPMRFEGEPEPKGKVGMKCVAQVVADRETTLQFSATIVKYLAMAGYLKFEDGKVLIQTDVIGEYEDVKPPV